MLGTSPALASVREELARLLALPAASARRLPPVLIQGETGTGKGLVAHVIHRMGPRADAAFVDVNCAAIPDTLLEAELFGFERGAFTDAQAGQGGAAAGRSPRNDIPRRDRFDAGFVAGQAAQGNRGSIGEAPREHALRAGRCVGDRGDERRSGRGDSAARRFREDLYHRLAVVTVQLPPLRERGADILLIARHYLDRASNEYRLPPKILAADAEAALMAYPWPGNVRELANLMERVALLSDARAGDGGSLASAAHAAHRARNDACRRKRQRSTGDRWNAHESRRRLRAEGWNISRAAARLGLPRNTLRYRIERHGLTEGVDSPTERRRSDSPGAHAVDSQPVPAATEAAPPVRWQRTRVTLLQAQVFDGDATARRHEPSRVIEDIARKASAFGGRILEVSARV